MVHILETKPYQSPKPTENKDNQDFVDFFRKAHAQSDQNSGPGAIHHTLDQPGGAAKFEHQHGTKRVQSVTMFGNAGAVNPGSGGQMRIIYQRLSRELVWVKFYTFFGTNTGKVVDNGWFYDWGGAGTFVAKDQLRPVDFTVGLPCVYFTPSGQSGPGNRHGMLVWDYTVLTWTYFWDSGPNSGGFNPMQNGRLTTDISLWDTTNGAVGSQFNTIAAQGVYQYGGTYAT